MTDVCGLIVFSPIEGSIKDVINPWQYEMVDGNHNVKVAQFFTSSDAVISLSSRYFLLFSSVLSKK